MDDFAWPQEYIDKQIHYLQVQLLEVRTALLEQAYAAIRKHRDYKGHARCWIDDAELYKVLPETVNEEEFRLPPKEEFLSECLKYHNLRQPDAKP